MRINYLATVCFVLLVAFFTSCDMRSGIAKDEMEKYESSPTPTIAPPPPAGTPIEPADVAVVDITQEGDLLSVDGDKQNKTVTCAKFNRLMVNGDDSVIAVKGACRQIMVNGDRNKITTDAALEFVLNGSGNIIRYARLANGKQPSVTGKQADNAIEKISSEAVTTKEPRHMTAK